MRVEIDQSGKVEDTNKPTVLAFSNGKSYTIKVDAVTKQRLQYIFRINGRPNLFIYRTFASLVFILIKDQLTYITSIVIDVEYLGHEKLIEDILLELLEHNKQSKIPIHFKQIGHSPAHHLAYKVFRGVKKENKLLPFEEVVNLAIKKDR